MLSLILGPISGTDSISSAEAFIKLSIELKCTFVEDMLPETAYIKLGWILGQTKDKDKVKELMLTNIAGEITERTDNKSFLY